MGLGFLGVHGALALSGQSFDLVNPWRSSTHRKKLKNAVFFGCTSGLILSELLPLPSEATGRKSEMRLLPLLILASFASSLAFSPRAVLNPLKRTSSENKTTSNFCLDESSMSSQGEHNDDDEVQQTHSQSQSQVAVAVSPSPFEVYSSFVARRPFLSNILQGFILFCLSDIMAQVFFSAQAVSSFSVMRAINAAVFGALYSGVLISQWILLLDRWLPGSGLGWRTGTKVAANAFVFGLVGNSCNVFCR